MRPRFYNEQRQLYVLLNSCSIQMIAVSSKGECSQEPKKVSIYQRFQEDRHA